MEGRDPRVQLERRALSRQLPPFGFGMYRDLDAAIDIDGVDAVAPLWFLAAISAVVARLALRPPTRFTIRTLLATLNVAALLLGGIVVETR